ncbi:hypothetical protein MRX96_045848 [Rhipicephalus microplus]
MIRRFDAMRRARFSLTDFDDSELPPWSPDFYGTDGFSPPSQPSTLRRAGKRSWLRRHSNLAPTQEDGSYVKTITGSFATRTRKPRKPYSTHAGSRDANRNARSRRRSFGSRAIGQCCSEFRRRRHNNGSGGRVTSAKRNTSSALREQHAGPTGDPQAQQV